MMTVFLPCRAGSERVPNKNTKPFAEVEGGLLFLKIKQLLKAKLVDNIVVSTNDNEVKKIVERFGDKIIVDNRPEHLASSSTSTDDLIKYVPKIIKSGHVLWTHVTSPFLKSEHYDLAIKTYLKNLEEDTFDSLMSVNNLQTFLWDKNGSINYDRNKEKWPRTQTLPKLYEINSGIFINSVSNYKVMLDRIGAKPFLFETKGYTSFDIDWPDDFDMAELIYKHNN
ncbi:acylneuraminate cytidylyltransferase family protein [Winogradskyella endarachnes]|uniref:Acylneuraminate cytidylyltransferase family protein n=1 Tax=Winogradskyella endarachnes TaxID=2681965 RepID=A0A6L6UE67_9FLAO|nr:acylneuraminate cytidylyltransferase family protein [Winogradskyella endarachnes]MUU79064.1 acylneuraminate cytidylyltransferase family protein [Winogradskyella endarachnes]